MKVRLLPAPTNLAFKKRMDKIEAGYRVWDDNKGRHGTITALTENSVRISWTGCGHCGLRAVEETFLRSTLKNPSLHFFPPANGQHAPFRA
jgi:hypothetical protein